MSEFSNIPSSIINNLKCSSLRRTLNTKQTNEINSVNISDIPKGKAIYITVIQQRRLYVANHDGVKIIYSSDINNNDPSLYYY
jgi:hypothetical protein